MANSNGTFCSSSSDAGIEGGGITHIVLIKLKEGVTAQQIDDLKRGVLSYEQLIPGISHVEIETPFTLPPNPPPTFDLAIRVQFESIQALEKFGPHVDHQQIKNSVVDPVVKEKIVLDWNTGSIFGTSNVSSELIGKKQPENENIYEPITQEEVREGLYTNQLRLRGRNALKMPILGFGTWSPEEGPDEIGRAVIQALEMGYRHFDFAEKYGNEAKVGEALQQESGNIARENLFLSSKVWNTNHHPDHVRVACEQTLERLGTDYLDCYLMHWPVAFQHTGHNFEQGGGFPISAETEQGGQSRTPHVKMADVSVQETWQAMERLVDDGLVKSIGVSNFGVAQLSDLITYCRYKPVVNQVELHPYLQQPILVEFCHFHGIHVVAYAPLGRPGQHGGGTPLLENETVQKIAANIGCTPAQVLLRWAVQYGVAAVPKSANRGRMVQNLETLSLEPLSQEDMDALRKLDCAKRYVNTKLVGKDCGPPFRIWGPTALE